MFTFWESLKNTSINTTADIASGVYRETQTISTSEYEDFEMFTRSFTRDGDDFVSVIDCILIDNKKQEMFFQDFILVEYKGEPVWRSGDGNLSNDIAELLPAGIPELRISKVIEDGDVIEVR